MTKQRLISLLEEAIRIVDEDTEDLTDSAGSETSSQDSSESSSDREDANGPSSSRGDGC